MPADSVRHVLCLAGSLRHESWNRRLLQAATALAPPMLRLAIFDDLPAVPLFNEDLEQREPAGPAGVRALRQAIAATDGLIIATPEYNQSIPGVLKNTLDWLSRASPSGEVLVDKPVAVLGASSGPWGTRLAQAATRQVLHTCGALVMPSASLYVAKAALRFDAQGMRVDAAMAASLLSYLSAFAHWIERVAPSHADARNAS